MSAASADHFMRQSLTRDYPRIVRGEGIYLIDDRGRRIMDGASGGVGPCNLGHGREEIISAMAEQARTLAFAHISMYETEPQIALANKLCAELAQPGMAKAYFTSTGTEAMETAVKLARLYHLCRGNAQKYHIISLWNGYHGSSIAAMAYSGRSQRRGELHPYYFSCTKLEPPYCYHCPYGKHYPQCGMACAWALETALKRVGPEQVSCFLQEPVGNTLGCVCPPPEYFPIIRQICDKYDVVFVADEVVTGMGRCGKWFALEHWDTVPDLVALGKGLAAGYSPLAATLVHEKLWQVFDQAQRSIPGFTYAGNPVSCAAGLATLRYIEDHNLVQQSAELGAYLHERACAELLDLPLVGDVRGGKGLYLGVEYVQDKATREPFPAELNLGNRMGDMLFENGLGNCPITAGVDGLRGDVTVIKPAFIITREEIDRLVEILRETIVQAQQALGW